MNFRDEYKKSAESLSPDREAIDRMKAAIRAQLENEQTSDVTEQQHKKPLPLKRIAYIGGAAAACAVITVSAFILLPVFRQSGSLTDSAGSAANSIVSIGETDESAPSADNETTVAGIANNAKGDGIEAKNEIAEGSANEVNDFMPNWSLTIPTSDTADCDACEPSDDSILVEGAADEIYDEADDSFLPDFMNGTLEDDVDYSEEEMTGDADDDIVYSEEAEADEGDGFTQTNESCDVTMEDMETNDSADITISNPKDTGAFGFVTPEIMPIDSDRLLYEHTVYRLDSSITSSGGFTAEELIPVRNVVDLKDYSVGLKNGLLYLFDISGAFLGAYSAE